ncbi:MULTISPECIES: ammonium transporter [unclassified Micromonospora]|uniref:ammonium transporter n=1 Tax=unclassified Micromonospora TaxID=2617518 RepID=UPI0010350C4C|nr:MULTISPECIES: ammonium transporter [unclassified Micromonospora]QKW12728.1 ammonium transporter [Verrucosispora sp. NA02020]TBL40642.1 ammonium transporter [Verrucosispora sp. SN26_14.1]
MPGGREYNPRGGSVPELDSGATAWILTSAALVLLMTPGLALFYGGMTRSKSVLNMMMMSFGAIGLVSLLWVFYGYSIAFGDDIGGITGDLSYVGLRGMLESGTEGGIPDLLFAGFQLMFAVITVALISGAIADRAKFGPWLLFAGLWATLVYFPVAHWVWGGGWIGELGVLDFAGGTAVHINAGAAALALALVLGRRVGWPKDKFKPHNLPMVLLGAALLWFGWFGFNAGSAGAADGAAAVSLINTQVATAAAVLGWIVVEWLRDGKPTTLGAASGAIAGLVGITPACAFLEPLGAIALGLIAGAVCALAVGLKYKLKYDDSLDVVAVHMVGGIIGSLLIGFLAIEVLAGEGNDGLLYGGGIKLLGLQTIGVVAVLAYSFVVAYIIGFAIEKTIGFRLSAEAEVEGIDNAEHAESAYEFSSTSGGGGGAFAAAGIAPSAKPKSEPTEAVSEKVAG